MRKKILLLLLLPFIGLAQLPETFDSGIPSTWAVFPGENGEGTVETWSSSNGIVFCFWEDVATLAEDWLVTPQVTISSTADILVFDASDANPSDYGSNLYIKVSTTSQTDISSFTNVSTFAETALPQLSPGTVSVDLSAYNGQSVYIAFVWSQDDGDAIVLDNVDLVETVTLPDAPDAVTSPTPANGATGIVVDDITDADSDGSPDNSVNIAWTAATTGGDAFAYKIYWGSSATSLSLIGTTPNPTVDIYGLTSNTTYYWSIVASNTGGDATGSAVWSFTTGAYLNNNSFNGVDTKTTFYPNPATDFVTITLASQFDTANTNVSIFDLAGKKVASFDSIENVTVENLQTGVYVIEINDGVNKESQKLIKK